VSGANGFGVLTNVGGAWVGDLQQFWSPTGSPDGEVSCGSGRTCTVVGLLHSAGAISVDVFRGTPMPPRIWPGATAFLGVSSVAVATCGMVGYGPEGAVFAWYGPVPA
jgi:hypothetical protein